MDTLISEMPPHHLEHRFRYPQKARTAELGMPSMVAVLADDFLRLAFDFINGHGRIDQ
jgi:hypothetical protein